MLRYLLTDVARYGSSLEFSIFAETAAKSYGVRYPVRVEQKTETNIAKCIPLDFLHILPDCEFRGNRETFRKGFSKATGEEWKTMCVALFPCSVSIFVSFITCVANER